MGDQLRFADDLMAPVKSATAVFDAALRSVYADTISDFRRDMNRAAFFLGTGPRNVVQTLFEREPQCKIDMDIGEEYLYCNLPDGHRGSHYDGWRRLEWSERG